MKRVFFKYFPRIVLAFLLLGGQFGFAESELVLQGGTFLKAINQRQLASSTLDEGDVVTFLNPEDVFIDEIVFIPKNSLYKGFVEKISEPVEGVNAVIKIKINKIKYPNGKELPVNIVLWSGGNEFIGGELTPVRYYANMPHYADGFREGVLQFAPTIYRHHGVHKVIPAGEELILLVKDDIVYYMK